MLKSCIFLLFIFTSFQVFSQDSYTKLRQSMVKYQIEARNITDKKVLEAMENVPRHLFVPDNVKKNAYEDRPLPIGFGQTISQPYIVALMTELLELKKTDKVLEIGTGSGYQAAVLAEIVDEVYTIEIYNDLSKRAKKTFEKLSYKNIKSKNADGYYGWSDDIKFDAIIVTCAPSFVPPPLLKQLKVGGLMVIPVGPPFSVQRLLLIKKIDDKKTVTKVITSVIFVPLTREVK